MAIWDISPDQPECTCADWGMMGCLSTCKQEVWRRKQAMKKQIFRDSGELDILREKAGKLDIRTDKYIQKILYTSYTGADDLIKELNDICEKENWVVDLKDIHINIQDGRYSDSGPDLVASYSIPQTIDELKMSIQDEENRLEQQKNEEYKKFLELQKKFSLTPMEE